MGDKFTILKTRIMAIVEQQVPSSRKFLRIKKNIIKKNKNEKMDKLTLKTNILACLESVLDDFD